MKYLFFVFLALLSCTEGNLSAQVIELPVFDHPTRHDLDLEGKDELIIRLKGLSPGEEYTVYLPQDHSFPILSPGNLPAGIISHDARMLSGVANDGYVEFCLNVAVKTVPSFRIFVEKGERFQPGGALKIVGDTIETEGSIDLEYMLNTIFRKDSCFALTPLNLIGEKRGIFGGDTLHQTGVFRNGDPTVGIDSGLIVSTGWVENAPGPNFFASSQSGLIDLFPMNDVDPDALALVPPGIDVYDIAVLEFEFIPTTDTISFNYVFFSEQYCASGNGITNDAFGFLLTGPDGVVHNIARLPISGDVVSPATLNPGTVDAAYFRNNTTAAFDDPCVDTPPPPERLTGISYDGFSTVLQAKGAVVPCAPHTLKIVVVDAGDFILDSGVLLEAGSFLAGLVNKPEPNTTADIDVLQPVEGCDSATIRFTRRTLDEPFINTPLPVKYNVIPYFGAETEAIRATDPANTAGADYLLPPSPFVIPGGDTSAVLTIPILSDLDFSEGLEAFIIRYDGTCDCTENADTFWIQDNVPFEVELGADITSCAGAEIELTANPLGGNGTYSYSWPDPALTNQTITYTSTGMDTSIIVNVTDGCGLFGIDTIFIGAPAISAATANDFYSLCSTPTASVLIDLEGSVLYDLSIEIDSNGVRDTVVYRVTGDTTLTFDYTANVSVIGVADLSGCGGSATGTATIQGADISLSAAVEQAACGQSIGAIDLTTLAGNGDYTFEWLDDASETTATRSMLPPGTYTVVLAPLIDASCTDTFTYELAMPAVVQVDSITFAEPSCAGETIVLAPVVSGGTPPYTFSWPDSVRTDSLLTIVTSGGLANYPFEVTDSCGFTARDTVFLEFPEFSVELTGRFSLCDQSLVNVPFFVNGPVDAYSISMTIDSAGTQVQRTLTTPGGGAIIPIDYAATITITGITNSAGCPGDIISDVVTVVDPMINFNAAVQQIRCEGENTGSISLLNASTVPVIYTWADVSDNTSTRTGLEAGTYNLTITDAVDPTCFRDSSFVISEPVRLTLSVGNTPVTCREEIATLAPTVSGGTSPYSYDWDNGLGTDSLYQITTTGGMTAYPLAVTDACGMTLRDTVFLNLSDSRVEVSGTYSICNAPFNVDVPIILTGSGPFTFVIRENGIDRSLTVTGDTLLNYTAATTIQLMSVTSADNCPGTAGGIATVTDGTFDLLVDQTNVLCSGTMTGAISIVVNGDNSIFDFSWGQAGLAGPNVTGLAAGTYTLTITDQSPSACPFDTTFNILEPASAITLVSDSLRDETCRSLAFGSANYSGGTGQLTYRWSNGTTGNVLGEVPAGLYTLSVTDVSGCEVTQVFNLQDQTLTVLATISASDLELSCTQLTLDLSAAQNTQAVDYAWTNSGGTSLGTTRGITIAVPGRYYVLITNPNNGCSAVDSIDIIQSDDVINLELPLTSPLTCITNTVDLTVTHPDFTGAVSYEWTFNGGIVGNGATLSNISTIGTYEVEVTRTDNGCQSFAVTEVVIDRTAPTVNVSERTVTSNCRAPEVTIGVTATGPNTFAWSTINGNLIGATDQAITTADQPGIYTAMVTDTTNGCTTTETVTIVQDGEMLTASAGTDQTLVCTGLGTVLNGSFSPDLGRTEMIWFDPAGNEIGMGTQVFTTVSGQHLLEVVHPVSGCSSFDTVMVINNAPTAVTYSLQQPPCLEVGGRLFVNSVTGLNGPFDFSSPTGESEPFIDGLRGLQVGTNVLIVTDQLGCELRDTFLIFDGEGFTGNAPDVTINLGEEATLGVTTNRADGQLVSWDWGNLNDTLACLTCPDPTTSPLESFIATVTVTDTNGCELLLRQNVIVDEGDLIFMPTAFSPANGDGVNDVYTVFGNPEFINGVNYLRIFDRWGNQVFGNENFSVNDPDAGWNGNTLDGQLSPSAVYVFVVSYERFDGVTEIKTGGLTLVR
jgi:gliding motility-associated-like protein